MRDIAESLVNDFFPFWPIFRRLSLSNFAAGGHFSFNLQLFKLYSSSEVSDQPRHLKMSLSAFIFI